MFSRIRHHHWQPDFASLRTCRLARCKPVQWCSYATHIPSTKPKTPSLLRRTFRFLYWLPLPIAFTQYCYTLKTIRGRSMQPTLNPDTSRWDDIVVFDHYSICSGKPVEKGDVVCLSDPVSGKMIVKRVVAVAGDVVQTLPPYADAQVPVPEGHIWVEGDEPFRTLDSNKFGPVPLALVDAKLSYIVWPPHRIGPLKPPEKPVTVMGVPRDSQWHAEMAAFERERKRQARVKTVPSNPPLAM